MKFLQIENDTNDRALMKHLIGRTKHWIYRGEETVEDGIAAWKEEDPQIVLIDIAFPGRSDSESFDAIKRISKKTCVIAVSGDDSQHAVQRALQCGAAAFINKKDLVSYDRFHDAILKCVQDHLNDSIAPEHQNWLQRVVEAIWFGNGKPSIMARLESIDGQFDVGNQRMAGIEGSVKDVKVELVELKKGQDKGRVETRIRAVLMILLMLITVFKLLTNQSPQQAINAINAANAANAAEDVTK